MLLRFQNWFILNKQEAYIITIIYLTGRKTSYSQFHNSNLRAISIPPRYRCCCVRDVDWTGTIVDGVHQQTQADTDPIGDRTSECYYDFSMVTFVNTSNADYPGASRNP